MSVKNINADELQKLIKEGNAELIDIREVNEYDTIHLKNSKLIPMMEIRDRFDDIDWNKEVVLVCRSGSRTKFIADMISDEGKDVYNLEHGLLECYQGKNKADLEMQGSEVENYFL